MSLLKAETTKVHKNNSNENSIVNGGNPLETYTSNANPDESIPNFDYSVFKNYHGKDESMRSIKNLLNSFEDAMGVPNLNLPIKEELINIMESHANKVNNNTKNKINISSLLKYDTNGLHFHDSKKSEIVKRLTKSIQNSKE